MPKPVVKFDSPAGLFLAALKRCPDRPAFVLSGSSLSYREAAEQIARIVREMAALPGDSLALRIADHDTVDLTLPCAGEGIQAVLSHGSGSRHVGTGIFARIIE